MPDEMTPATARPITQPAAAANTPAPSPDGGPGLFDRPTVRMLLSFGAGITVWIVLFMFGFQAKVVLTSAFLVFLAFQFVISRLIVPEPTHSARASAAERNTASPQPIDNTREIVETVVFVVVLVLLLKSFVAEAFVIPTGSMAETLWGYQKVVTCPECKFQFPVNASQEAEPQDGQTTPVVGCECPNCRQAIVFQAPPELDERRRMVYEGYAADFKARHRDAVVYPDPNWTSGDRVLVSKFLYEMTGGLPNRLDVVVFKFPGDSGGPEGQYPFSGPVKNHVPINYIKRLIGLPGEMIAIKAGKLYCLPAEKVRDLGLSFDDLAGLTGAERDEERLELWRKAHMHVDNPKAMEAFEKGLYPIIKKPPETVLAMMRIVNDNDHQAANLANDQKKRRWPEVDGWSAAADNSFVLKAADSERHWVRYRNVLRDSDKPQLIADFMSYNSNFPIRASGVNASNWVGDLILECEATVEKAEGELMLELSRGPDRFRAVWDLSNGRCTVRRLTNGVKDPAGTELASTQTGVTKGTHSLRFANVDRRLTLWVDNRVVEWSGQPGVDYPPPASDLPTKNDLEPASVGARGAGIQVKKLKLWRDTYYTVDPSRPDTNVTETEWSDPEAWKGRVLPAKTLYVQPGHFLCLGDNSPESSDGRSWGTVPERLLLGRAQVVYYPFFFPWWPLNSHVNRVELIH